MSHPPLDILWVLIAACLVFVMQAGFAMLESGFTRSKNSINVAIKNLTDFGVAVMVFWAAGFALMFGASASGWIGTNRFAVAVGSDGWLATFFFFQVMFAGTSATIVSGAVAERMRFSAYLVSTVLISLVVYPVFGHWVWGGGLEGISTGWLALRGFVDFAGSTVVHSVGGWMSLALLLLMGPRIGRFPKGAPPRPIPGSNIPSAVLGAMLLFFGWFGFNGGSVLAMNDRVAPVILNTTLGGASGMVFTILFGYLWKRRWDTGFSINGVLAGLVAVTANCHAITEWQAVVIGAIGGLVMLLVEKLLEKLRIDDAVGAVPVHLGAGIWGTLAVGLFGDPTLLKTGLGRMDQIGTQLLGIAVAGVWTFAMTYLFMGLVGRFMRLRVTEEEEQVGLNVSEHGAATEIFDLTRVMEQQANTGDLALRVPVEPFTEVGQIATQYNKVMDSLQSQLVARSEYTSILGQVSDGLFLVDEQGLIGHFYSTSLESILETKQIAGETLIQVITPLLKDEIQDNLKEYLGILFNPELEDRNLTRLNPLSKVDLFIPRGSELIHKHVQFLFKRIREGGKITRLMVLLRDITAQVNLEEGMESEKKERDLEMNLFYRIIHIEPALLAEFIGSLESRLASMNALLEGGQENPRATLERIFQQAHGLKGEAALFDLQFIVDAAQGFEEMVKTLQRKEPLENSDFIPLTFKMGELDQTGRRIASLLEKLRGIQSHVAPVAKAPAAVAPEPADFPGQLESLGQRIAGDLFKSVRIFTRDYREDLIPAPHRKAVRDILVQLVRNAVFHGIESPEERTRAGKAPIGTLRVWAEETGEAIVLGVRDDGQGVDGEALKRLAVEKGHATRAQVASWTATDMIRFLFTPGMSSAKTATPHGGQGVGLPLVREKARTFQGKISVKWRTGVFMEFTVKMPTGVGGGHGAEF